MFAFVIWSLFGLALVFLSIFIFRSNKPVNVWANAKAIPIDDVISYNKAIGKLFCIFGIVFIILGLPLLLGKNSPLIIFTIAGCIFECIFFMASCMKVENKYRKKS